MENNRKDIDDLKDNFFLILILNLFFAGSSVVFIYLIVKDLLNLFI